MAASKAPKNYRQYPLFGEPIHDTQIRVPNLLVSSALVTGNGNKRPLYTKDAKLRVKKFSGFPAHALYIDYVGEELRINDIETLGYLMRECQFHPFEETVIYVAPILNELERSDGTRAYDGLKDELNRLGSCVFSLNIYHAKLVRAIAAACSDVPIIQYQAAKNFIETEVQIFEKAEWVESAQSVKCHIKVQFSKKFLALIAGHYSSYINLNKFRSLESLTAKRLVLLLSCHSKPWPYLRDELIGFMRPNSIDTTRFKKLLDLAFSDLVAKNYMSDAPIEEQCKDRKGKKAYTLMLQKGRKKADN